MMRKLAAALAALGGAVAWGQTPPDLIIADFDGPDYGGWVATGTAFGPRPARGTLPNQMPVTGFRGAGLVNTYFQGDASTGMLISPEFPIERAYLRFLIGGGKDPEKLALQLLIDGKIVRSATGSNDKSGGSEALAPEFWDVSEWLGKRAQIRIVDDATGGWGHLNVDQIVQTDRRPLGTLENATRTLTLQGRFLLLPVKNGALKRTVTVAIDGTEPRRFEIELADGAPDWWAFMDIAPFPGRRATVSVDRLPDDSQGLAAIRTADELDGAATLYKEKLRPQFHFSPRRGWNNDPNGLVYYKGEYHLFFQHNPYGWGWGNMHWGHAVSPDLLHWKELPVALYPDTLGTMFSGSAVVDESNTAGFGAGKEKTLVALYTAAGKPFTQGLAFSNDRGRTWTKYARNPVLSHIAAENRDPKVIWYAPHKKWVMALYLDRSDFALFSSPDLKRWEKLSDFTLPGSTECPELFEIPVQGRKGETRWVFYGGNGLYCVGRFDGTTFTPDSGPHPMQHGNNWYASQTYSDLPKKDGRRILVPWATMATPGMPFNQMMGTPVELTLRSTDDGLRLFANPIRELKTLRTASRTLPERVVRPGENPLEGLGGELLDVSMELDCGAATEVRFVLRGIEVRYDVARRELYCLDRKATLRPEGGRIKLRFLQDRTSLDIFGDDGRLYMPMGAIPAESDRSLALSVRGGDARLVSFQAHELNSVWSGR